MFTAYGLAMVIFCVMRKRRETLLKKGKFLTLAGIVFSAFIGPMAADVIMCGICMTGAAYSSWLFPADTWCENSKPAVKNGERKELKC